jgi:hypothetical protein
MARTSCGDFETKSKITFGWGKSGRINETDRGSTSETLTTFVQAGSADGAGIRDKSRRRIALFVFIGAVLLGPTAR